MGAALFLDMPGDAPYSARARRTSSGKAPLLALATPVEAPRNEYFGEDKEEDDFRIGDVWNVIAKASALVKDGHRLENLAWRNWSQQRQHAANASLHCDTSRRRSSFGSATTASSASLYTPGIEAPPSPTTSTGSRSGRATFNGALKRLMHDNEFTDWVSEAQQSQARQQLLAPILSVPDTPIANVEIRLVEPTPVPSRVGSLGGSISASGLLGVAAVPPRLTEEPEAEEMEDEEAEEATDVLNIPSKAKPAARSPRKRGGKFFLHSSPSKGSGSDSASATSPSTMKSPSLTEPAPVAAPPQPPSPSLSSGSRASTAPRVPRRQSSASSAGLAPPVATKRRSPKSPEKKRHVSLSTMRGRFTAEKRRAAEVIERKAEEAQLAEQQAQAAAAAAAAEAQAEAERQAKAAAEADAAQEEDSGWEDEDEDEDEEDWSDDEDEASGKENSKPSPAPGDPHHRAPAMAHRPSSSRSGNSSSALDLTGMFRTTSRRSATPSRDPPPPPAPTPLRSMSKRERLAAAEERRAIEAELEAQQKREMFAKQQIFGTQNPVPSGGLLSGIFKRGGSMVNLTEQAVPPSPPLKPCPTHGHLPSLARSPITPLAGPTLLRSKSAVAVPVQTGVSVTRVSPRRSRLSEEIGSGGSGEAVSGTSQDAVEAPSRASRPAHRLSDRSVKTDRTSSKERNIPEDVELESDSESDEEDSYLATSSTRNKLALLAHKAEVKGKGKARALSEELPGLPMANPIGMAAAAPLALPNPVLGAVQFDEWGVTMPMTPTTRRREIIKREMSESLRRNLILEREKSSGGQKRHASHGPAPHSRPPPSTHTSLLPARHSSANLANHPMLSRHKSEVSLATATTQDVSVGYDARRYTPSPTYPAAGQAHQQPGTALRPTQSQAGEKRSVVLVSPPEPTRRRTQPNVLGGYLRPLTRVGGAGGGAPLGRAQSSANLVGAGAGQEGVESVEGVGMGAGTGGFAGGFAGSAGAGMGYEAPAMVRRSTEGSPSAPSQWKDDVGRRRELVRQSVAQDNGYRTHGW